MTRQKDIGLLSLLVLAYCIEGKTATEVLTKNGDLVLGGLFPIHKKSKTTENACGVFALQPGYQYMIAMLFALEKINNDSSLLRNISLGTTIYDTCQSSTIGADRAKDFIKHTLKGGNSPLVGVVGPFSSDVSIATAPLLRVFGIPQVSYGSTSAALSNKQVYGNFFRTVPSDHFQAKAIVDILRHFGWNYISTVNSKGHYGEKGMEQLKLAADKHGICIATSRTVPYLPTTSHYEDIMNDIKVHKHKNANVIVLFTTQTDSAGLLKAASALGADSFTWIGSSGWSNRMDVIDGRERIANGSITVNHLDGYVEYFEKYYYNMSIHMQNPWSREFFNKFLECNNSEVKEPFGNTSCWIPNMELSPVRVVINAVYAFAHALQDMQAALCPGEVGVCAEMKTALAMEKLVGYLRNASFPDISSDLMLNFNEKQEMDGNYTIMNFQQKKSGDWDYVNVGEWGMVIKNGSQVAKSFRLDEDKISWGNAASRPPESICSKLCVYPKIRQPGASHPRCCWNCISCQAHQIIINDSCQSCPLGYRPQANFTSCGEIPQVHPDFTGDLAIIIVVLTVLGIVGTCLIGVFFVKHLNHPVVKASGRELSFIIALGILLCYAAVFPAFTKPSPVTCGLSRYFGSVCYTFCYAPLLMKTIRIYRIFTSAKKSVARPSMVSPKSQVLVTSGLILIQFLVTTLWILSSPPRIQYNYLSLQETVLECQTNNLTLIFNLSYNVILILLCTLFAFKTRGFPRNFNEAKYIGIMMYLTCSIWITFLPSRLNTNDTYVKVYITTWTYFINGTITLIGLFGSKVKVILCAQEADVSSHGDISGNSNNKDFTRMRGMNNTSLLENQRADSGSGAARVNRLDSGHVFELGHQASRTTSSESPSPSPSKDHNNTKDIITRNGTPLSLVVPELNAEKHENAWLRVGINS